MIRDLLDGGRSIVEGEAFERKKSALTLFITLQSPQEPRTDKSGHPTRRAGWSIVRLCYRDE